MPYYSPVTLASIHKKARRKTLIWDLEEFLEELEEAEFKSKHNMKFIRDCLNLVGQGRDLSASQISALEKSWANHAKYLLGTRRRIVQDKASVYIGKKEEVLMLRATVTYVINQGDYNSPCFVYFARTKEGNLLAIESEKRLRHTAGDDCRFMGLVLYHYTNKQGAKVTRLLKGNEWYNKEKEFL